MKPGQYALFPHFRSDGWIYFLVRDKNNEQGVRRRQRRRARLVSCAPCVAPSASPLSGSLCAPAVTTPDKTDDV